MGRNSRKLPTKRQLLTSDLEHTWPAVSHDDRSGIFLLRKETDKVHLERVAIVVDLGFVIRERVDVVFSLSPVHVAMSIES